MGTFSFSHKVLLFNYSRLSENDRVFFKKHSHAFKIALKKVHAYDHKEKDGCQNYRRRFEELGSELGY